MSARPAGRPGRLAGGVGDADDLGRPGGRPGPLGAPPGLARRTCGKNGVDRRFSRTARVTGGKDDLMTTSPLGLHRVIEPPGVLPQAAWRLDASPAIAPDEVRIRVDRLNLDAASYRQIREAYAGDPDKIRAAVLDIITTRGKMQNPVTGSGGMLTGTVDEVRPRFPARPHPRPARRHPGLPHPDPAADHRRAECTGTASRSRCRAKVMPSSSRGRSRRCCPTTFRAASARRHGRVRRSSANEACGDGGSCGAGCGRCGEERLPVRGSGPPGRRRQGNRRRPHGRRSRPAARPHRDRGGRRRRGSPHGVRPRRRDLPRRRSPLLQTR